jgi:hypothetical protein
MHLEIETNFNESAQNACLAEISQCKLPSYDLLYLIVIKKDPIALKRCPELQCLSAQDNLPNYLKCLAPKLTVFNPNKPDIDGQIAEPFSKCQSAPNLDGLNHD